MLCITLAIEDELPLLLAEAVRTMMLLEDGNLIMSRARFIIIVRTNANNISAHNRWYHLRIHSCEVIFEDV